MHKINPNPVDAAIRTGEHLQPQPIFFNDFTRKRNMARDLGHQAAECGGLIAFRQMKHHRLLANVVLFG